MGSRVGCRSISGATTSSKWKRTSIPRRGSSPCEGETIVGYALCRWERAGEPDRSTVRYVAVRKPWRKRGIALALLHAAFGGIYRHGKRGAGLGVDATSYTGADRLYVRAGMRRAFETLRYGKVLRNA